jgi:aspartyl-tRNA(Asn)/glutamyl-tRNA(Gln) amidotransferase subunit A
MIDPKSTARASLTELCTALRERTVSAVELMEHTLRAIDKTSPLWLTVVSRRDPDALLVDARAAQARIDRGEGRPLEGVPLGVKDLEDAAGLTTTYGSKLFFDAEPAARDSIQVSRLRAAGAIVVGKTNTPEFGHAPFTKNLIHGVTCSPWDPARSPGGSSGGAAAAIVGGVLPLVTASDGGGSIRVPASFCGAFGFKPSHGRVPIGPREAWDPVAMEAYGTLTKTVSDAACVLDVIAGPHDEDVFSLPGPHFRYTDRVEPPPGRRLRIAYSRDLGSIPVQEDIATVVDQAVHEFRQLGHEITIVEGGPPDLGMYWGLALGQYLDHWIGAEIAVRAKDVTRTLIQWIEASRQAAPAFWGEQARARMTAIRWFAALFSRFDILLTPTVPCDPPAAKGPAPTHVGDRPLPASGLAAFTMPANVAWLPAATVRAGASHAGLPVGLQIMAPRGADDRVLSAARAFERHHPWHPNWPIPDEVERG